MRLIDADALKQFEITMPRGDGYSDFVFAGHIHQAPTIDAVPVIRCKDCRFYRFHDGVFGKGWMCFENNAARKEDDYCSRGERKNDV